MKPRAKTEALTERVVPEWYYWIGVVVPGALMILLCVNRTPVFGLSVWVANLLVLAVCAAGVGSVTYWGSNFAAAVSMGCTIIGGSMALAVLSHLVPVLGLTGGALWTGCPIGLLVGLALTAGEYR